MGAEPRKDSDRRAPRADRHDHRKVEMGAEPRKDSDS
jgi:hypothetical protein